MIGDTIDADIKGALNIGIPAIWYDAQTDKFVRKN